MIDVKHLSKSFGEVEVLKDINETIDKGEKVVIVGPSGSGKSTFLRCLNLMEKPTSGDIFFEGENITQANEHEMNKLRQRMGMVFQHFNLFPHMTILDNMTLAPMKVKGVSKEEAEKKALELLDRVGLADRANAYPIQLSGGQKQRVALGRAIVREPRVFLLDEPLSNLDAKLRASMRSELTKLHQRLKTTFIYVTHDQVEAMTMATRIVVMKDGVIQQVDTPQNLYDFPCNIFVAGFIGTPQMNFIKGTLVKKGEDVFFEFGNSSIKVPKEKTEKEGFKDYIGKEVIGALRPELLHDEPLYLSKFTDSTIEAYVEFTELMGAEIYLCLKAGEDKEGDEINLISRVSSRSTAKAGDTIKIAIDTSRMHFFDKDTEQIIVH